MCRSIKRLRRPEATPTEVELHGAALQFIRKISGFNEPSQANRVAFDHAVTGVATAARRMFDGFQEQRKPRKTRKSSGHG